MIDKEKQSGYLAQQVFISFDSETTGLWAPVNRMVELAGVKFSLKDGLIDRFQSLINPMRDIPKDVIEIHGIRNDDVVDAPPEEIVLNQFIEFCGNDSILIAHNAPFDISFVNSALKRNDISFGENLIIDTVDIFKRFFPGLNSYSLINLSRNFKIAQSQDHRALADANLVFELFQIAANKLPTITRVDDIKNHLTVYDMNTTFSEAADMPTTHPELSKAIDEKLRVEIIYVHPQRGNHNRIIQPKEAHKLGSTYYVTAYCEYAQAERTFRLDRIESCNIITE